MSELFLPITDQKELKHIFQELQKFDMRLFAQCYIVLLTGEEPQALFNLKVRDFIPFKEYKSSHGYTISFSKDFRDILLAIADGKGEDEFIFESVRFGTTPTIKNCNMRFFQFKNKTGISINFTVLQRTFIYNHFITTGTMPTHAPTRYHGRHRTYIQEHLNLTDKEFMDIKSGNLRTSILSDVFPDTVYIPSNKNCNVRKRVDTLNRFRLTTIKKTASHLDEYSDTELSLLISALTELEEAVRKTKEVFIAQINK